MVLTGGLAAPVVFETAVGEAVLDADFGASLDVATQNHGRLALDIVLPINTATVRPRDFLTVIYVVLRQRAGPTLLRLLQINNPIDIDGSKRVVQLFLHLNIGCGIGCGSNFGAIAHFFGCLFN